MSLGASIDEPQSRTGRTPLHIAVICGSLLGVEWFLARGASVVGAYDCVRLSEPSHHAAATQLLDSFAQQRRAAETAEALAGMLALEGRGRAEERGNVGIYRSSLGARNAKFLDCVH